MSNYTSKHSVDKTRSGKSADAMKKKVLIIVIVAVLAVIIAATLIFIFVPGAESGVSGFFGGKPAYVPETQDGTTIISPYYQNGILPSAADRHDVDVIKGGGANGSDLLGRWQMGDHDAYLFDGQGRGIILTGVDNYTFTYSAENGKLRIDYDGQNGSDFEYDYTLNGDKMTWTRGGKTYDLTKVAEE